MKRRDAPHSNDAPRSLDVDTTSTDFLPPLEWEGVDTSLTERNRGGPRGRLIVLVGDDVGREFSLGLQPVVLGRSKTADIVISGAGVSRRHARIAPAGAALVIEDLGSRNGVLINGTPVQSHALRGGDRVQLATTALVFAEHDELADRVHQMQKLESLGRFASELSHDFNNLLASILANTEFAAELAREPVPNPAALAAVIADIRAAALSGSETVRGLLDFARGGGGASKTVDVADVVDDAISIIRRSVPPSIELDVAVDDALHVTSRGSAIQQVLVNLCINARDAMPDGGRLRVTARHRELDCRAALRLHLPEPGPHVEIAIADTGQGMDETTRARAFEPFFTTKPSGVGTGLGLSSVYGIIREHGGNVLMDSEVGRGTRVRVLLPASNRPVAAVVPPPATLAVADARTVLVIEDRADLRRAIVRLVSRLGYATIESDTGSAGIELFRQQQDEICAVLLDFNLPDLNGDVVCEQLRRIAPNAKVVLMSGSCSESVHERVGTDYFLAKPFSPADLQRVLPDLGAPG